MALQPSLSLSPAALLGHADFVRRVARALLGDAHAAEDVAQDTLAAAVVPGTWRDSRAWLATVARNFARQWQRGQRRRVIREAAAARPDVSPSPGEVLEREALRAAVVRAVLALPEPSRGAVLMRFWDELPPRRIAAALGVPVETVRTRIKRGLAQLRADLEEDPEVRARRGTELALLALSAPPAVTGGVMVGLVRWTLAAVLLLAAGLSWWLWSEPAATPTPEAGAVVAAAAPGLAREPEPEPRQSVPARALVLAGRVLGPDRAPVAGASVYLGAERPSGPASRTASRPASQADASVVRTGTDGTFRADLGEAPRGWVEVVATGTPLLLPPAGGGQWHTRSRTDLELVLVAAPTGVVEVTVALAGGGPLADFAVTFWRRTDGRVLEERRPGETASVTLGAGLDTVMVRLQGAIAAAPRHPAAMCSTKSAQQPKTR